MASLPSTSQTAARIVEKITGERPHAATLHRWASCGRTGVKLRTAYAGGHRRTTEDWIREFFDAVTQAASRHGEHVIITNRARPFTRRRFE
ncbi:MAG: DUF1580 domain-containing protein [Phycisphaera sp. RhM]|nr:DUF1580 domain-containing protein [Phycisphaera sp. RhM]